MSYCVLHLMIVGEDALSNIYKAHLLKMNSSSYLKNQHKDSGFDIYIPPNEVEGSYDFKKNSMQLIDLKIRCAAYRVYEDNTTKPQPFYVYARSSISKTPFRLANNVGIIDSGYRGNLKAALDNATSVKAELLPYTRLLQICMPDLLPFKVVIVNSLDDTTRGDGGFGSTGNF